MKQKLKSFVGVLLTLAMIIGLMPGAGSVNASGSEGTPSQYKLWIDGTQVTSENLSGNGWSYDPVNKILTLENASITSTSPGISGITANDDLKIRGSGTIKAEKGNGINCFGGNLTIENGDISITGGVYGISTDGLITLSKSKLTARGTNAGIGAGGSLIIDDSEVNASGKVGIYTISSEDFTVNGNGTVVTAIGTSDCGIQGFENVNLNGGIVTAKSDTSFGFTSVKINLGTNFQKLTAIGGTQAISTPHGIGRNKVPGYGKMEEPLYFRLPEKSDFQDCASGSNAPIMEIIHPYYVTIAQGITNGTVTADTDAGAAAVLDTIKLTVAPADGYGLFELTASSKSVQDIKITKDSKNPSEHTFIMPAEDVSVNAVFKLISTVALTAQDIVSGKDETILAAIPKDASGTIDLTVTGPDGYCRKYEITAASTREGQGKVTISGLSAGKYRINAAYSGDEKYLPSEETASFTVFEKAVIETAPKAVEGLVYDGRAHKLVTAGKAAGGIMQYALGTDPDNEPSGGWSTSVPTGTDAGTYYVWYKVKSDADHYDSSPAVVTVTIATKQPEKNTPAKGRLQLNSRLRLYWKGSNVVFRWGKVSGADTYKIWMAYCGSRKLKKVATVSDMNKAVIKKLGGKKPDQKRIVKAYVTAYRKGTKIGRSKECHCAGPKNRHTNAKKIKTSKNTYKLKVGRATKLKAKTIKIKNKRPLLDKGHGAQFRYASSDNHVATVSKNGKIRAVGTGKCNVWVYALNGVSKKVTVIVQ